MSINAYEYVFPVVAGELIEPSDYSKGIFMEQVYGTAFSIGQGWFMSAGHVVLEASEHGFFGLGFPEGVHWKSKNVTEYEINQENDVAILKCDVEAKPAFEWVTSELDMLTDVIVSGYPYAVDFKHFTISIRSFKGHIVSSRSYHRLPAAPRVFELSFQAPRGISGAPLILPSVKPKVAGIIIENHSTKMRVLERYERQADESSNIIEEYEVLHLGIAIQAQSIVDLGWKSLNGTLLDFISESDGVENSK